MPEVFKVDSSRVAKNTLFLYARTLLVMIVSLFTSRITLQVLGIDNYGIQSAVGGVVGMFNVISGSLSGSISRYITFEIGHGDKEKLNRIFCISINIQIVLSLIIIILTETVGVWFLNNKMVIPEGRMVAANWVLQCSILSFIIGLFSVPYNAEIIGHEKMDVFAYVGIVDVVLRLAIVYLLYISPIDKLIAISILSVGVSLIIRIIYAFYCKRHFEEAHFHIIHDKELLKDMSGFAGWSFLTNTIWVLNTQGINILINLFFGVALNAARGVATMLEGALKRFTGDFTTAFTPQITKSYAVGDKGNLFSLINRGAKFSYYLLLLIALPFMFEAQFVLDIWLDVVPDNSVSFFRLSVIASMVMLIGDTGFRACMATGKIRNYTIVMAALSFLVFPLTYLAFKLGASGEAAYIVYIVVYFIIDLARLPLMKKMIGYSPKAFFTDVLFKIALVTLGASIPTLIVYRCLSPSVSSSISIMLMAIVSSVLSIYLLGLTKTERVVVKEKVIEFLHRITKG